jgi:hypothetical protein
MARLPRTRSQRFRLPLACALAAAVAVAPAALLASAPAFASGKGHAPKSAAHKPCYESGSFKGHAVRVPTSCAKPQAARKCYLTSVFDGRSYHREIDCLLPTKRAAGSVGGNSGNSGNSAAPTSSGSGSGSSGSGSGAAPTPSADEGVNWSTAHPALCDDSSTPTSVEGYAGCSDDSGAYCDDGTAYVVVDPQNQSVVCLPNASVPSTGVCDDGSQPGSGGAESDGTPICTDGDDAYLPGDTADDSASNGTCDDGSNPGDGGNASDGAPLCADGSDPSY